MMKALSIASIFALGFAGAACSQASDPAADETNAEIETIETADAAADTGGSFNLGLPEDVNSSASANDGFNLDLPAANASNTDGFNLGTDVSASNGLSDLPELTAPIAEEAIETAPEQPVDDEPVIRLD